MIHTFVYQHPIITSEQIADLSSLHITSEQIADLSSLHITFQQIADLSSLHITFQQIADLCSLHITFQQIADLCSFKLRQNAPLCVLVFKKFSAVPTPKKIISNCVRIAPFSILLSTFSQQFKLPKHSFKLRQNIKLSYLCVLLFKMFSAVPTSKKNNVSNCVRMHHKAPLFLSFFSSSN